MLAYLPDFFKGFLSALVVNLQIACLSLLGGVLLGAPLGYVRSLKKGVLPLTAGLFVGILRAFPVFVLMFVLLNLISHPTGSFSFIGLSFSELILVLALCAYSVSVVADAILDAIGAYRTGQLKQAWLLLPNLFRIFVILVMSTSIGAAIGVQEAVTFTLRSADMFSDRAHKIGLVVLATVFFAVFFGFARGLLDQLTARLKQST